VPRGSAEIVVVSIIVQSSLDPTLCVRDPHSPHRGVKPFSTDGQLAMMVRVLDTDAESCLDRVPIFLFVSAALIGYTEAIVLNFFFPSSLLPLGLFRRSQSSTTVHIRQWVVG